MIQTQDDIFATETTPGSSLLDNFPLLEPFRFDKILGPKCDQERIIKCTIDREVNTFGHMEEVADLKEEVAYLRGRNQYLKVELNNALVDDGGMPKGTDYIISLENSLFKATLAQNASQRKCCQLEDELSFHRKKTINLDRQISELSDFWQTEKRRRSELNQVHIQLAGRISGQSVDIVKYRQMIADLEIELKAVTRKLQQSIKAAEQHQIIIGAHCEELNEAKAQFDAFKRQTVVLSDETHSRHEAELIAMEEERTQHLIEIEKAELLNRRLKKQLEEATVKFDCCDKERTDLKIEQGFWLQEMSKVRYLSELKQTVLERQLTTSAYVNSTSSMNKKIVPPSPIDSIESLEINGIMVPVDEVREKMDLMRNRCDNFEDLLIETISKFRQLSPEVHAFLTSVEVSQKDSGQKLDSDYVEFVTGLIRARLLSLEEHLLGSNTDNVDVDLPSQIYTDDHMSAIETDPDVVVKPLTGSLESQARGTAIETDPDVVVKPLTGSLESQARGTDDTRSLKFDQDRTLRSRSHEKTDKDDGIMKTSCEKVKIVSPPTSKRPQLRTEARSKARRKNQMINLTLS
eukprot:GHVH01005376.1.p1 GENE.GHVH01005376.1~~GHVH01005376.1.p1  ORF type:complete len:669 (+),score=122.77 GHVH01005376.1:282-2009(+)